MNGKWNNMCGSCLSKKTGYKKPKYAAAKKTASGKYYATKKSVKNGKKN